MKRRDFLVGGIPAIAAIGISIHHAWPKTLSTNTVKVGTTEAGESFWPVFVQAAAQRGIIVNTINFSNTSEVNSAEVQRQTDVNLFQHLHYLAQYMVSSGNTLVPVGATEVVPLPLYSHKYRHVADIPRGAQIVISNDLTNQGRGLNLLRRAGLVDFTGDPFTPTPAILLPSSRVTVVPVAYNMTAHSLDSVAGAVINNDVSIKAGLDPDSAIFKDDPRDPANLQYTNIIACRPGDEHNPNYLALLAARHDPQVLKVVAHESKNTSVEMNTPQPALQKILDELVAKLRVS